MHEYHHSLKKFALAHVPGMVKLRDLRNKIRYKITPPPPRKITPDSYFAFATQTYVHKYVNLEIEQVRSWCIMGGYLAHEAVPILENYPKCKVTIFECSRRYIDDLFDKYQTNPRVEIVPKAASNFKGKTTFYETSREGNGSLLRVGKLGSVSYRLAQAESYEVETMTLDEYFAEKTIDVLQIDVQGGEMFVLEGALEVLKKTKAVLIEVSVTPELYEGSVLFDELYNFFKKHRFRLALHLTDFNLVGDALFVNAKYPANPKDLWGHM